MIIQEFRYGTKIIGVQFIFEAPGDVGEWHNHETERNGHITIVAKGDVLMEVRGNGVITIVDRQQEYQMEVNGEGSRTVHAGDLIDTPTNIEHQWTALTPDARLFNLCKDEPALD